MSGAFIRAVIVGDESSRALREGIVARINKSVAEAKDITPAQDDISDEELANVAAKAVLDDSRSAVLLFSTSGNGIQMYANKYGHVRAAPCFSIQMAKDAVLSHGANMCEIPSFYTLNDAEEIAREFITQVEAVYRESESNL